MKLFILLLGLTINDTSFAQMTATVKMVKGNVTKMAPGMRDALAVKRGDVLEEDTSIVTGARSFARIVFSDKSKMNIAPKSMVRVAKMPKKKANVVKLLTGMVKAEVTKEKKKKTKMIVKTRTAVMGVRGTKFQSTYNPVNKNTSLVTVEGKVAMAKVDEAEQIKKALEVAKKQAANPSAKPISIAEQVESVDELEKIIETSKGTVEVPAGRYAGVAEKAAKPTPPVKIAPKQYNALAKSMNSKKTAKEVMKVTKADKAAVAANAPKSGGFLDFVTGLYVEPEENAKFDEKTGTYEAKDMGKVNQKTGDYIPPKGVKVDAKKGFVVDTKETAKLASNEEKQQLQKTIAKLNKKVEKQIVVNKIESKPTPSFWKKYLPKHHILTAEFRPYSESLEVEDKDNNSTADLYSERAFYTILGWTQVWGEKWSSRIRVGGHDYEIEEDGFGVNEYGNDDDDGFFSIGVLYKYNEKITLSADIADYGMTYYKPQGQDEFEIRRDNLNSLDLGIRYHFYDWRNLKLNASFIFHLSGEEESPGRASSSCVDNCDDTEKGDTSGFTAGVDTDYFWSDKMGVNGGIFYKRSIQENSSFKYTRNALGMGLNFFYDI